MLGNNEIINKEETDGVSVRKASQDSQDSTSNSSKHIEAILHGPQQNNPQRHKPSTLISNKEGYPKPILLSKSKWFVRHILVPGCKALLALGLFAVLGALAALGIYVVASIMWVVTLSFCIAAIVEGGIGLSYINRFFDHLLDPDKYKRQVLANVLLQQSQDKNNNKNKNKNKCESNEDKKALDKDSQKFIDYYKRIINEIKDSDAYLDDYHGSDQLKDRLVCLTTHRKQLERYILSKIEGKDTPVQLGTESDVCLAWPNNMQCQWSKKSIKNVNTAIARVQGAKVLAGCSAVLAALGFGLGTAMVLGAVSGVRSAIFYKLFAFIGCGGVITAMGPIGLSLLVGLGAIAYGMMVYQATIDIAQNQFVYDRWLDFNKLLEGKTGDSIIKRIGLLVLYASLMLFIVGLTILTAGGFWWPAKYIGPTVMVLFSVGSWPYKLSTTVKTIEALKDGVLSNPFTKAWKAFTDTLKETGETIRATWKKESWMQFINPFRVIKFLIFTILDKSLFLLHFIPAGFSADRFADRSITRSGRILMAAGNVTCDVFEDTGPCFQDNPNDSGDDDGEGLIAQVLWRLLLPLHLLDFFWRFIIGGARMCCGNDKGASLLDTCCLAFHKQTLNEGKKAQQARVALEKELDELEQLYLNNEQNRKVNPTKKSLLTDQSSHSNKIRVKVKVKGEEEAKGEANSDILCPIS